MRYSQRRPAMTPADEATFITLWSQGLSQDAIAQRLGIPIGTVKSRAHILAHAGKITPRPRGGARQAGAPVPVQSGADMHGAQSVHDSVVQTTMHGAVQVQNSAELPIPAALAEELGRLWAAIDALRQDVHRPVHDTVQSLPEPLFDDPVDNATERWNLYLKHGLRVRIEALAQARGVAPSRVVAELLWTALTERRSSIP
jgi:hypothetical protein